MNGALEDDDIGGSVQSETGAGLTSKGVPEAVVRVSPSLGLDPVEHERDSPATGERRPRQRHSSLQSPRQGIGRARTALSM